MIGGLGDGKGGGIQRITALLGSGSGVLKGAFPLIAEVPRLGTSSVALNERAPPSVASEVSFDTACRRVLTPPARDPYRRCWSAATPLLAPERG